MDTFLGYNVMWFYPVAWLFQLTGPDYTALRVFFFLLCTITGVLAFFIVRRVTGSGWYSVLAALGPVLIPGMLFRNYMAFLAMLNMLALLQAYVFEQPTKRRQILWMTGAGAVLGLTYLMRIDLGAFFTLITAGLIALYPFGLRGSLCAQVATCECWGHLHCGDVLRDPRAVLSRRREARIFSRVRESIYQLDRYGALSRFPGNGEAGLASARTDAGCRNSRRRNGSPPRRRHQSRGTAMWIARATCKSAC